MGFSCIHNNFKAAVRYKFLISRHIYRAPSVLRTLFHNSFDMVRLAVCVDVLPLNVIKFPPTAILIRFGSSFCGRKSTTIRA